MHIADFAAGSIGGACGVAVGYPLDTVKVRIQTQKQFTGIWHCFITTLSKEGVHGFFKGMSLPVTTVSMTSSVVFGMYRNCRQCLSQLRGGPGTPNTKLEIFLSGLAGGVATVTVMSPGDIVKVRLQCQTESLRARKGANLPKPKYRGPVHCLLTIVREEGVLGLYRGALPLMLRDGPSYATYFLTYSTLCEWFTPTGKKGPEWTGVMLAGGVAGMTGWTVGTPMDVIKARLQMDGARDIKRYKGFVHCITETVRVEGSGVFFRSLGINCLRAFPVNMVVFATYELLVGFLRTQPDTIEPPKLEFE
ncbi:solute carrier family 25 member 47-A isoform X1 [Salmo salar]|uniref:Solute carrier family 25 member 47-A isoform X1 n=2 Tax=Salmo salar TaxID=8030 RepID=A0A1S3SAH5_SALSA|nr:solute carrier family 25 member 47-A isoform X1 [Salmo salar]|eukprot:XP_014061342.1 PREDICTED: solute carrier family 25 member 47-A-like isoform X1 [Salmo salar]